MFRKLTGSILLGASLAALNVSAAQFTTIDDVVIMSGESTHADIDALKKALTPAIQTLVLDGLKGADYNDGWDLAAVVNHAHVRTVAQGFCNYNCARMFLSGTERMFADTKPINRTSLLISGNAQLYDSSGVMYTDAGQTAKLIGMPRNLVDKWAFHETWGANNSFSASFMMVFHPSVKAWSLGSMLGCPGGTRPEDIRTKCEPVADFNALSAKIITTSELFKVPVAGAAPVAQPSAAPALNAAPPQT